MKKEFMTDINKIKFEVYREVARMAYDGKLKENADQIPYNIIPGNLPQYRCCVYKEREIIRQRVRLAEGHTPIPGGNIKNIVQVCFIRPKVRPYETDNFYAVLQRQDILDKEVYRIVSGKNKVKPRRQKAD